MAVRGDDRVAEDRSPFPVTLVGSENDTTSFVTGADKLEEDRCAQVVKRQVTHFVDHQHLRSQIDP